MRNRASADAAIYAPLAGGLYGREGRAGGAELQSLYLARALARHGLRVRHIVFSQTSLPRQVDGVELVVLDGSYARGGLARRRAILRALRAAAAAVYVQRSAGFETGMVGVFARATGRRLIFSSSHEADFTRDAETARSAGASLDDRLTRLQYRVGLRCAHVVVAQTEDQRDLARQSLGIRAEVIRSFCELPPEVAPRRDAFLWVGGLVDFKDPHAYVELARRAPELPFRMVATDRGEAWRRLAAEVRAAATALPNLELLPQRPRADLLDLYTGSVAVVNTSRLEGFPNTFLEAWARGTPALSLHIDPDRIIERRGLGTFTGGSMDALVEAARDLWARRDDLGAVSAATRQYVATVHDPAVVGSEWAALVRELL
jgi:glycosyltransferase involved in cell wall biosynthesis